MSSIVDSLYEMKYNPFIYGECVAMFYASLQNVERNLLLSPLIIPLCSHGLYKEKISSAVFGEKRSSSIWTIFSEKEKLFDLQERINGFEELTELSIQYALVNDWITIDENNLMVLSGDLPEKNIQANKCAKNLGKLFSGLDPVKIYKALGVTP